MVSFSRRQIGEFFMSCNFFVIGATAFVVLSCIGGRETWKTALLAISHGLILVTWLFGFNIAIEHAIEEYKDRSRCMRLSYGLIVGSAPAIVLLFIFWLGALMGKLGFADTLFKVMRF